MDMQYLSLGSYQRGIRFASESRIWKTATDRAFAATGNKPHLHQKRPKQFRHGLCRTLRNLPWTSGLFLKPAYVPTLPAYRQPPSIRLDGAW